MTYRAPVPWPVDKNTGNWSLDEWWDRRGICRCGHPIARHEAMPTGAIRCAGVLTDRKRRNRLKRPESEGGPEIFSAADRVSAVHPCRCNAIVPTLLVRDSRPFRRAPVPGQEHPFNLGFARVQPESILMWAPGQPKCGYGDCTVSGADVRMYFVDNLGIRSEFSCREHAPVNLGLQRTHIARVDARKATKITMTDLSPAEMAYVMEKVQEFRENPRVDP